MGVQYVWTWRTGNACVFKHDPPVTAPWGQSHGLPCTISWPTCDQEGAGGMGVVQPSLQPPSMLSSNGLGLLAELGKYRSQPLRFPIGLKLRAEAPWAHLEQWLVRRCSHKPWAPGQGLCPFSFVMSTAQRKARHIGWMNKLNHKAKYLDCSGRT